MESHENFGRSRGWRLFWNTLRQNPITLLGLGIILLVTLSAVLAPQLAPYDYDTIHPRSRLEPPSREFLLGTDHLARDLLSRMLYGARVSLVVGVLATLFSAAVGTLIGTFAGYQGGWSDEGIMRVMDVILAFPSIILAITLVAMVGPGMQNLILILGIIQIPAFARLTRGSTLALKEQEFVIAARSMGQRDRHILRLHILPNILTPIVVLASLSIATAIISEAALSFLGLGIRPPQSSWGTILKDGQRYMLTAPWVALFPGIAITLTVLGYNLFGDGLRDALDPKSRKR
jgi:ABC-type dipeptide/oligopeptide/nickel transport system permease subunit